MQIELRRLKSNRLYTEGQLFVNEHLTVPYTIEHTFTSLPVGEYSIRLSSNVKRRRVVGIFPANAKNRRNPRAYFEAGHSYLSSKRHRSIVLGESLIPGAVKKGVRITTVSSIVSRSASNVPRPSPSSSAKPLAFPASPSPIGKRNS